MPKKLTSNLIYVSTLLATGLTALGALAPLSHALLVDRTIATINNEVLLQSDVGKLHRTLNLRRELDPLFGFNQELLEGPEAPKKVQEFLVQERLISQNFKVNDTDVEQEVNAVQKGINLDREQLISFLRTKGFNYDDYFELMRIGLQKRNLIDREIRSRVNISDDDIRNYFTNVIAKNEQIPVEYNIQIILINEKNYKKPEMAHDTAQSAWRAVKQGEPFADVARRHSDDPSASLGGELGYMKLDQINSQLRDLVQKLQIGQVSDVIKANYGYFIARLVDSRSAESERYNEMKETIREQLAKEEYKKQLVLWAERAKNAAHIHYSPNE